MTTFYRVKRRSDGKFSTGTTNAKFTVEGKVFCNRAAMLHHLRWFKKGPCGYSGVDNDLYVRAYGPPRDLDDYIVEEYNVGNRPVSICAKHFYEDAQR